MRGAITEKDGIIFRREAYLTGLFLVTALLVVFSLVVGTQRQHVFEKEKSAALEVDKSVWMNQGERNPHSAAHFSRYAFRPAAPLSLLDPGTSDFSGLAIWMEAHYQDPAVFRRAEDGGELSRYTQLTPAFIVLVVAPLILFLMLHGSVAAEREDGTLRQLLATGVSPRAFFLGKYVAGVKLVLVSYTAVFLLLALACLALAPGEVTGDTMLRLGLLYLNFAAYLLTCTSLAIAFSALFSNRQSAFLALVGVWVVMMIFVPRLGSDISTRAFPQPDARAASAQLSAASMAYYSDETRVKEVEQEVLDRYGVASVEELPINYDAYVLQISEKISEPEFDRFYAELDTRFDAQESIVRGFSILTPIIAATNLSRSIAGTDRLHQQAFARAAESHRRKMVQLLNEDYMYNAGTAGTAYKGDQALWSQFEDLEYSTPAYRQFAAWTDAITLLLWALGSTLAAYVLVSRAVQNEVPAS